MTGSLPTKNAQSWWQKLLRKRREKKLFGSSSTDQIFEWIYRNNKWGDAESVSGSGSNLAQTSRLRAELPELLKRHGVRSLLDAPCGDFHWMAQTSLGLDQYVGADIVAELVARVAEEHGAEGRQFICLDLIADTLPSADALLCRDCLVHLDYERIAAVIANIKRSGIPLLLTTSHRRHVENENKLTGQHRFLNLQQPPFNWPAPIDAIEEDIPSPKRDSGKILGLWRVADIRAPQLP